VVHLGFEVRVELTMPDGASARAQLTRAQTAELGIDRGDRVFVRPPDQPLAEANGHNRAAAATDAEFDPERLSA
jgi:hypothetical protein